MIYRVTEDVVERRLLLAGRRGLALSLSQSVLALVILGFLAAYFTGISTSFLSKMPADWLVRFDCWWRLVAALAVMGLPALLVGGLILRAILHLSDGWRSLLFDERAGMLTLTSHGGWFGFGNTTAIPLSEIRRIDLHASPAPKNLALLLTIHLAKGLNRQPLEGKLAVQHVNRREEAMDLLFRIARVCGLGYYAVETSDLRHFKLRLVREPQKSDRFQPVPEVGSAAQYEDDGVLPHVPLPELRVAKFRPENPPLLGRGASLLTWQPGEVIEFFTPAAGTADYCLAAGISAAAVGFLAYNAAPLAKEWLPAWAFAIVAACGAAAIATVATFLFRPERRTSFDWKTKTLLWRRGNSVRQVPFESIAGIRLHGRKRRVKRKNSPDYTQYWCRLEVLAAGSFRTLADSPEFRDDPDGPAQSLGPLAAALGEALGVPWQWRDYDE